MAAGEKIKILHVSDLHIDTKKGMDFHNRLYAKLVSEFKGKVDYLILGGDFGNRCDDKNVDLAKGWLTELRKDLGVAPEKVILCAGNHELIQRNLPVEHAEHRLKYEKGRIYPLNEGEFTGSADKFEENKVFETYYDLEKTVRGSVDEQSFLLNDFDDVRFIVLNSSRLTQESSKAAKATVPLTEDELDEKYGTVCVNETEAGNVEAFKWTLNYSENERQQLHLRKEQLNTIETLLAAKNDKLNIIIFHHPEQCLHHFERFPFVNMENSGLYDKILGIGDLLICGHIHPTDNVELTSNTRMLVFVGGAAHYVEVNNMPKYTGPPVFYYYEFEKDNDSWSCNRLYYRRNIFSTSDADEFYKGDQYLPLDMYKLPRIVVPDQLAEQSVYSISSEKEFKDHTAKVIAWLIKGYLDVLQKTLKKSANVFPSVRYVSYNGSFPTLKRKTIFQTFDFEDLKLKITLDFIPSTFLSNPLYIRQRIYNGRQLFADEGVKSIFLPIVFDISNAMMEKAVREKYYKFVSNQLKSLYTGFDEQALNPLFQQLGNFENDPKMLAHNFLKFSRYLFITADVLEKILNNVDGLTLKANYDARDLVFSIKKAVE